jgi:acyl-CoA synthetase (AMP-forming)/AMP-acid ligase II
LKRLSIFAAAREAPNRLALITKTGRFTFSQLAALTAGRAAALVELREPLLLQPQLDLDSLLWIYAAAAAGTPFVSLHAAATAGERAAVQSLTGAQNPPRAETAAEPLVVEREVEPEAAFCLILTSGSTGAPKVVVLSRRAVLASAAASESNLGLDDEERWLLCMSLAHVGGLSIVLRMLAARRAVVLFESGASGLLSRMTELGRRIQEERVTLVSLVPPLLDRLLRDGFQPTRSLRAVLLGGAGCSSTLAGRAQTCGVPLLTSYGLTETGSQIVTRRYADRDSPLPQFGECVSSGHPLAGVEIKIVGERIAVKTAALLSGYIGEATPAVDVDGWFVTSDRGTLGPHGELYVLGRTDSVIVTGGENVDPEEVERALRVLPEIQDACVFGLPCVEFGQRVVAVVVRKAGTAPLQLEHLTEQLRSRLARFKLPRTLVIAEALPFTASGKLDRRACAAQWGDPMFIESRDSRPPRVLR